MMFMTDAIEMDARMDGGLLGGLKRKFLAGESFFITYFKGDGGRREGGLCRSVSRQDHPLDLSGQPLLCQSDAFLCAIGEIDFSIAFTKRLGAGFFGGEGFILQKIEGRGELFIHSGGTIVPIDLKPRRAAARRHRLPRRARRDRRLRHRPRRRHQDEPVRRRGVVLRGADRARPRVAADAAVLAAGRSHPQRVSRRPRRREARLRRRARQDRRPDRRET